LLASKGLKRIKKMNNNYYKEVVVGEVIDHDEYEYFEVHENAGIINLCTLGNLALGAFRHPEDMRKAAKLLLRSLNNILDYQDFLTIESKMGNEQFRPIGIGITGLAYWASKRNFKYGEPDMLAEVKCWMEALNYYLMEENVDLAKERGKCKASDNTLYGKGKFIWENRTTGVNELTDFTPEQDWESLRTKMIQYGVRNSVVSATPPSESCLSWQTGIALSNNTQMNFHELLESQGIDWKYIESTCENGTVITLNNIILVKGMLGATEVVESVVYNGFHKTTRITFEDNSFIDATDNHRLLLIKEGVEKWVRIFELVEGDEISNYYSSVMKIKKIDSDLIECHTWDITTTTGSYILPNGCVSHNSSVVLNSTNGIEMPMVLIQTKESKGVSLTQVVPEYNKLKNKYQLLFDQTDCIDYIKTAAVIQVYTDQGISSNTFYSPHHFPDKKIPTTLVVKNLMLAHYYGLKTHYYNISNKSGVKSINEDDLPSDIDNDDVVEDCDSCKL